MEQVIIHIDLDFFYGQVEQAANPSLISLPFAIQQKHIVVTCNYLARAAGVKKLQLLTDAKRCCPGLIIVNGEDIQRYRDASKAVFRHVRALVGEKVQRLGMDELWLDVSEHISRHEDNMEPLSSQTEQPVLFELSGDTRFTYDPRRFSGHVVGSSAGDGRHQRLLVASHLAAFLRESIRSEFSFTSSGGISMSKLLAKLVGDQHKPNDQTILLPESHQSYLDKVEVKKIAGVGYKILKILYENLPEMIKPDRRSVEVPFDIQEDDARDDLLPKVLDNEELDAVDLIDDLDDGEDFKLISKEKEELLSQNKRPLTVLEVRTRVDPALLLSWLDREVSTWLWDILHAKDDSVVVPSDLYPKSIGVEDSFLHCTTMDGVRDHLLDLTTDLVFRMENDLTDNGRFVRFPSNLRLTPRFRGDQGKGQWWRHKRTSRSVAFPVDTLITSTPAEQRVVHLVDKILMPLFAKMAEAKGEWDLSLLNVAVADFKLSAPSTSISTYLTSGNDPSPRKRKVLKDDTLGLCPAGVDQDVWKALDEQSRQELLANDSKLATQSYHDVCETSRFKHPRTDTLDRFRSWGSSGEEEDDWPEEEEEVGFLCEKCSSVIPEFAVEDHICIG